jgi:biotin transport system substrate-specific component
MATSAFSTSAPLIDRLWAADRSALLRNAVLVVAGVALLTLSAKYKVPFYPVPATMQTLVVLLIGAFYGWRLGALTVLAYLASGVMGMPVFTNTPPAVAGPLYFMGPTAGFLAGFVASAMIVGLAIEKGAARSIPMLAAAMLTAQAVVFGLGYLWLAQFASLASGATGLGFGRAFTAAVQPFIIGDLLKTAIAVALTVAFVKTTER